MENVITENPLICFSFVSNYSTSPPKFGSNSGILFFRQRSLKKVKGREFWTPKNREGRVTGNIFLLALNTQYSQHKSMIISKLISC